MSQLDREHHSDLRIDAEGQVTFRGLIPGAPYRLRIQDDVFIKAEQVDDKEKEFTVQSGQQCDLGTVIVKRP